ncbi:MAG: SHOCT domain-containing protein [Rhodospirillales bacterium]|nr:SHOCT domain-containing protein [Rhodospirillales bacterium]
MSAEAPASTPVRSAQDVAEATPVSPAPARTAHDVAQDVVEAAPVSPVPAPAPVPPPAHGEAPAEEIFFKIERLADLRKKGVLSEDEFAAKKAELLSRL